MTKNKDTVQKEDIKKKMTEQEEEQSKAKQKNNPSGDTDNSSNTEDLDDNNVQNEDVKEKQNASEAKSESSKQSEKSLEDKLKDEIQAQKEKYMRLVAEFENYKKRTSKERLDLFKSANREVMQALLPVVDDFNRAIKNISSDDNDQLKGIKLIHNKLNDTLKSQGLTEINVKEGDKFDADIHEAVTQVPAPKPELKGKIVDVVEKGYSLGDKILRFPKVVTGK
ncbi:MAG: nucleotide exchange factor GrpE [Psychroflexus sp.]|jgi:molecular chaperone GrpE|nr:nucleotide exchange factor GrpE [Psychroflexus sp.]MDR9447818.1 nucleotide exchange factor GrpE [Psychroflexus sp.]